MKNLNNQVPPEMHKKFTIYFWFVMLLPFIFVSGLLLLQSEDNLPPVEMLDNPPELQASLIIAKKVLKKIPLLVTNLMIKAKN